VSADIGPRGCLHQSTVTQTSQGPVSATRIRWARLGEYEVIEPLGQGGMGVVYRARDLHLGRQVALKLLPGSVVGDPEWLARFEREARVLASLNHPNIATLYGFEQGAGVPAPPVDGAAGAAPAADAPTSQRFLVMEVVEGETLAERLRGGPLPLAECLEIFVQIARGLDAAHEKGIVHRDLKPANVKIGPDDRVKILDFGLAKAALEARGAPATGTSGSGADASESPTWAMAATQRGEILGTPAYMSPEQARGIGVDKRTDVWAFGCCLFEALTGRAVFAGDSAADILAAVLREEPDWEALRRRAPPRLERLVRRCLERKTSRRLRDIGDAALELEDLARDPIESVGGPRSIAGLDASGAATAPEVAGPRTRLRTMLLAAIGAALALALAVLLGSTLTRGRDQPPPQVVRRFSEPVPDARSAVHSLALSGDGALLAIASSDPSMPLRLRRMNELESQVLRGTEAGEFPFFSPDGEWLAFFTGYENALKKVPTRGGQIVTLAEGLRRNWGGSWGTDDHIVFHSQSGGEGLSRVASIGGAVEVLTTPRAEMGEHSHRWPDVLPNGRGVVFTIWKGSADASQIAYLDLRSGEIRTLLDGTFGRYLPTGHLSYFMESRMMAVGFDAETGAVAGAPVPVQGVEAGGPWGYRAVSVTADGLQVQALRSPSQLVWITPDGVEQPIALPRGSLRNPTVSPDGTRIAVALAEGGRNADIWSFDVDGGRPARITSRGENMSPVWTPDGEWILYWSEREGVRTVYRRRADGTGEEERLVDGEQGRPVAVSPDGRWLTTNHRDDVWAIPLVGGGEPQVLIQTDFVEGGANYSPDGRWIVWQGFETGTSVHYIRRADGSGARINVSSYNGGSGRWSRDGRQLYTVESDPQVMVVRDFAPDGTLGPPRRLFEHRYHFDFDVAPDGRLLVVSEAEPPTLVFVDNWFRELRSLFPGSS
jgi:serine/threonine-protein kinase